MKKYLNKIEETLKIKFNDKSLLLKSFIHKSFDKNKNNEKLEFLGDRVIGLIISKKLISMYPKESEGIIDKKFANLVNKKTCAEIGKKLELHQFVKTGNSYKNFTHSDEKILSDTCEALIGSVYLDQGFFVAERFVLKHWDSFIKNSGYTAIDSKTKLQEFSLKKYKKLPVYKTFKKTGPNHNPIFKVQVQIQDSKKFIGQGNSKKIAQQDAASKLIKDLIIK
tara:strand:+ start:783 stop:1451 length:669 start_codon:yes stop_codon:yes gene_type:complete